MSLLLTLILSPFISFALLALAQYNLWPHVPKTIDTVENAKLFILLAGTMQVWFIVFALLGMIVVIFSVLIRKLIISIPSSVLVSLLLVYVLVLNSKTIDVLKAIKGKWSQQELTNDFFLHLQKFLFWGDFIDKAFTTVILAMIVGTIITEVYWQRSNRNNDR